MQKRLTRSERQKACFMSSFQDHSLTKRWVIVLPLQKRCHVAKENKIIKNSLHEILWTMYDLISFNNKHYKQNIWKTQCWNNNFTKVSQLEWTLFTQCQIWYHYLCMLIKQERESLKEEFWIPNHKHVAPYGVVFFSVACSWNNMPLCFGCPAEL